MLHGTSRPEKGLTIEAVRLASRERVQQRLPLRLRAAGGSSVGGSAEDGVSSDTTSAGDTTVAQAVGEARLPGKRSTSTASEFAVSSGEPGSARPGEKDTNYADGAAVVKLAGEVRLRVTTKHSTAVILVS